MVRNLEKSPSQIQKNTPLLHHLTAMVAGLSMSFRPSMPESRTLDSIWSDAPTLERYEVISIVWHEFNTLRQAAGLPEITRN